MIGFQRRFHPAIEQARAFLAKGRLGKIRMVQTVLCEPLANDPMPEWRKDRANVLLQDVGPATRSEHRVQQGSIMISML